MTDIPRPYLPPSAEFALDRAQGFACALGAMGFMLGDFEAGFEEQRAIVAVSDALLGALRELRIEFDGEELSHPMRKRGTEAST